MAVMMALPVVYCYPPAPRQQRRSPAPDGRVALLLLRLRVFSAGVGVFAVAAATGARGALKKLQPQQELQ